MIGKIIKKETYEITGLVGANSPPVTIGILSRRNPTRSG
jgi:hypothetical protein